MAVLEVSARQFRARQKSFFEIARQQMKEPISGKKFLPILGENKFTEKHNK